ncbi:sugar ABC transporter substrate-binding protein [Clostridiales bacterium COT073_COT-073]|nr:sugar ABC transporter substrate-binding protein [Clostridiales bacterium COT073_COT-073]
MLLLTACGSQTTKTPAKEEQTAKPAEKQTEKTEEPKKEEPKKEEPKKETQTGTAKVKIRFASWDDSESLTEQQKLVDQFNQSQDAIEVVMEAYGDNYDTKIAAGMGSKDAPDVMYMWNYPAYYKGLENLNPFIEKEGANYKNNFYETLWEYNSMNGEVYGIPVGYTTHVLYYNKDLFDKAGVAYPTDDWSWEDLKAAAKKVKEGNEGVAGFSFSRKPDPYDFEMYLWSNGAAYSNEKGELNGSINDEKSMAVFKMFQDMEKEGIAITTEGGGTNEVLGGKVAMYINGAWSIGRFNEAGLNYGMVKIPGFGKPSVSILSSSGLSMSKDSANKDAAWEFIKFWTGKEMNKARLSYELPVLKDVVAEEKVTADPGKKVFFDMLEQSAGYTPSFFKIENWSEISESLELAFEEMYNESSLRAPEEAINDIISMFP